MQIEIKRIRERGLASKILHFVSLIDTVYNVRCKTIETSIFHDNNNSFTGPLIIRTFEKRAPDRRHCMMSLRMITVDLLKACSMIKDPLDYGYCHGLAGRSSFLESPGNFRAREQFFKKNLFNSSAVPRQQTEKFCFNLLTDSFFHKMKQQAFRARTESYRDFRKTGPFSRLLFSLMRGKKWLLRTLFTVH